MPILKKYKCPNGFPPEDCYHAPQLLINVIEYFKKKESLHNNHESLKKPNENLTAKTKNIDNLKQVKTRR